MSDALDNSQHKKLSYRRDSARRPLYQGYIPPIPYTIYKPYIAIISVADKTGEFDVAGSISCGFALKVTNLVLIGSPDY